MNLSGIAILITRGISARCRNSKGIHNYKLMINVIGWHGTSIWITKCMSVNGVLLYLDHNCKYLLTINTFDGRLMSYIACMVREITSQ